MPDIDDRFSAVPRRAPWNKGKLIGAKPSLQPKHVWSQNLIDGRGSISNISQPVFADLLRPKY